MVLCMLHDLHHMIQVIDHERWLYLITEYASKGEVFGMLLSVCLSVSVFVFLFVCLFVWLSICSLLCLYVC